MTLTDAQRAVLVAVCASIGAPAIADDTRVWGEGQSNPSTVQIHEPTIPNAVATVTFQNTEVHGSNEAFILTFGDITINVEFEWNVDQGQNERITVDAPAGYAAVPRSISVQEYQTDVIHIIEWIGS